MHCVLGLGQYIASLVFTAGKTRGACPCLGLGGALQQGGTTQGGSG